MKRVAEESADTLEWATRKVIKRSETYTNCAKEWAFFQSLWPYEQLRWLYAMRGLLEQSLLPEVVRLILVDFMHSQCKNRQCNRNIEPLTERVYIAKDGPNLFKEMQRLEHSFHIGKVERERRALLENGAQPEELFIVHANYPYDGLGALMDYKSDFRNPEQWTVCINLPVYLDYTCVNIWDTEAIQMRLQHYVDHMEDLDEIRREVNKKMMARSGAKDILGWLSELMK